MAFGEIKYILGKLDELVEEIKKVQKTDLIQTILTLIESNQHLDLAILANPSIISLFVDKGSFRIINRDNIWGYYYDVPVYWSPGVKKEEVYLLDKRLGVIYVKHDYSIEISEIEPSEYDEILKNIDTLKREDLPHMVRVKANEVISFALQHDQLSFIRKILYHNK